MSNNENFVFYGSWKEAIDGVEQSMGKEFANEFARQIINFGTTGEITTNDKMIEGFINGMCKDLVKKSKNRYNACGENGKQGGRPKQFNKEKIVSLHEQGLTDQEIADNLGCSVKTIQRALMANVNSM